MDLSAVPLRLKWAAQDVAVGAAFPSIPTLLTNGLAGSETLVLNDRAVGDYETGLERVLAMPSFSVSATNTNRTLYWAGGAVLDCGVATALTGYSGAATEDYVSGDITSQVVGSRSYLSYISNALRLYGSNNGTSWTAIDSFLTVGYSGRLKNGSNPIEVTVGPPEVPSDTNLVRRTTGKLPITSIYRYFGFYFVFQVVATFYRPDAGTFTVEGLTFRGALTDLRFYRAAGAGETGDEDGDVELTGRDFQDDSGGNGCGCVTTRAAKATGSTTRLAKASGATTRVAKATGSWDRRQC